MGNHYSNKCTSLKRCSVFGNKHNTTLHLVNYKKSQIQNTSSTLNANAQPLNVNEVAKQSDSESRIANITNSWQPTNVLLATALVKIVDDNGCEIYVRALIDQCSQASFVSEYVFRKLKIAYQSLKLPSIYYRNWGQK